MNHPLRIHIFAGPNGAGKTTFARTYLPHAALAQQRVAQRVAQGGHHIPSDVIHRRFEAGLRNFHAVYKPIVNRWFFYDAAQSPLNCLKKRLIHEAFCCTAPSLSTD